MTKTEKAKAKKTDAKARKINNALLKDSRKDVGSRLKKLREDAGLTQVELAKKVAEIIGDKLVLTGDNGKQTISQLETGSRGMTIQQASAYADIFKVSLDFLFGRNGYWQAEDKPIGETLHLSNPAITAIKNGGKTFTTILNYFLAKGYLQELFADVFELVFIKKYYGNKPILNSVIEKPKLSGIFEGGRRNDDNEGQVILKTELALAGLLSGQGNKYIKYVEKYLDEVTAEIEQKGSC